MTTYQQNNATINGDTCAVSAEACLIGLGSPLGSFEKIIRSGVIRDIPQRILKMGQGESFDSPSSFALSAKEMRTEKALFSQLKVPFDAYLWAVRNFLRNLTAILVESQAAFAKRIFGPVLDPLNPALAVST